MPPGAAARAGAPSDTYAWPQYLLGLSAQIFYFPELGRILTLDSEDVANVLSDVAPQR